MSVSAVGSTVDTTSATSLSAYSLSTEDFYTLLITELQYQDPTDPVDNSEMINQLTGYSQLDALDNISESMDYLLLYQQSLNSAQAVSFIGKTVTAEDDQITVSGQSAGAINFDLESDAGEVSLSIYDADGNLVRNVDQGAMSAGEHSYEWDCLDDDGNVQPDGAYSFAISATDESGATVNSSSTVTSVVQGVSFENGLAYLQLENGSKIPLASVTEIYDA